MKPLVTSSHQSVVTFSLVFPLLQAVELVITDPSRMLNGGQTTHRKRLYTRQFVGYSDHAVATVHVLFLLMRSFVQCYLRFIGCNICLAMSRALFNYVVKRYVYMEQVDVLPSKNQVLCCKLILLIYCH